MSREHESRPPADLQRPRRTQTRDGQTRRVGVELEFTGLTIETISEIVRQHFGGEIRAHNAYEHSVIDSEVGKFGIELDSGFFKERGRREAQAGLREDIERVSEEVLGALAKQVVPFEIIAPPIALDEMERLHPLIADLRDAGARGTNESALYAFGLHLNPEVPDLDGDTLLGYIRAFCVGFDWLVKVSQVDFSRRVFPFIQPYSRDYVRQVCDPDYAPDRTQLIDDYLVANASRNRALDMLPIFGEIDEERVQNAVDDGRVSTRPALHYRLPNCELEQPGWDLAPAWNDWVVIDDLAGDTDRLLEICSDYVALLDRPLGDWLGHWDERFAEHLGR